MRRWSIGLVACAACGRIGFGSTDDTGGEMGPSSDAPPFPTQLVCAANRYAIPAISGSADLAIDIEGQTLTILWAAMGGEVNTLRIDEATLAISKPHAVLTTGPVRGIAGLTSIADITFFVTQAMNEQTLWRVSTGTGLQSLRTEPRIATRDPIVTDNTRTSRAWVRGDASGLVFSYVAADGTIGSDRPFATPPIISIAAANNNDHTHATWAEDRAGVPTCVQADLDLVPTAPMIGGSADVAANCFEPRIDSGPGARDVIFNIWRSSTRSIEARYHGGVDDISTMLATRGRSPRIRFDGAQFWAAWIDESTGNDVLRVAMIDQQLAFTTVDLPGWTVVSDEAFELVRVGSKVYVVVLSSDSISVLRTCP